MLGPRSALAAALVCLATATAHANGRLPGATGLAIDPADERQLLLGLTYGLALTRDGGASWTWMCEQQIEGNGGDVDPSIVVTSDGTLVVLSLTNGGVLVSQDDGCSFAQAMGPLQGNRGVDLTLDPSQPSHVLALMSTILEVTEAGHPRFRNLVAHSLDHGRSWQVLAELPDDLSAETLEIAPSDPNRIYVSGTASASPLQGIVERSDDGGLSWTRTTVELPRGSGSLFVSGIHPTDADRVWFRVPGRGDIYGVLPARLWLSTDGAVRFDQVAETEGGMLGFALSPDGERVVFGGPLDGLFVAPADASAAPSKISDLRVGCLRWLASGVYVCAGEPSDPFSLGFATEPTDGFIPLWHRADTCRPACTPPSRLERSCQKPWQMIAPFIAADTAICNSRADAAVDEGNAVADAAPVTSQPTTAATTRPASGCTVSLAPSLGKPGWPVLVLMLSLVVSRRLPPRSSSQRRAARYAEPMTRDPNPTAQAEPDPFHAGERALQSIVGAREQIAEVGRRIMRDAMPEQHRELFAKLPFVLCGSVDASGQPHASILAGPPGFVHAPHARELLIDTLPHAADPLAANLQPGASIGLLGIEPHTRRRNRMNGRVGAIGEHGFSVIVEQSFGNCPKYIQARRAQWTAPTAVPADPQVLRSARLDPAAERMIGAADTFYIASAHPGAPADRQRSHGVDVSHRGGKPGFVRLARDGGNDVLTVPDFTGNTLFNTLGNLTLHPRAGLLFIDYARGDLLHVAADAEIVWDGPELDAFAGAERLLRLRVRSALFMEAALPLRWSEPELSPFLQDTGAWPER